MKVPFDPAEHIRQLEDGSPYLDLKWRLVWLRSDHPDAAIETQIVTGDDDEVRCRATISLRIGGSVSAHGSARRENGNNPVEEAEDRALIRALAALGYGIDYIDDDDVETAPMTSPPVNLMTARTLLERETEQNDNSEPEPGPSSMPESQSEPEQPEPPRRISEDTDDDERRPADFSWTKFWAWARRRGYKDANDLSERLGVDVLAHTPLEVRRMVTHYELEHPPDSEE